jgi:hypothetical protein
LRRRRLFFGRFEHERQHHKQPGHDGHVGYIENAGAQRTDAHDHKIHHLAFHDAVVEIAQSSARNEAERGDLPGVHAFAEQGINKKS